MPSKLEDLKKKFEESVNKGEEIIIEEIEESRRISDISDIQESLNEITILLRKIELYLSSMSGMAV